MHFLRPSLGNMLNYLWVMAFIGLGSISNPAFAESVSRDKSPIEVKCHLSFPEAVVTDVNTVYIPFTLAGQLIMVAGQVDTVSGYFMLDTGSERLVLNRHYFPAMGAERSVEAVGNTGLVSGVVEKKVDSLTLSPLVIRELHAHVTNLEHIELKKNIRMVGILGQDVYKDFEVFIDFQNKVIVLHRLNRKGFRIDTSAVWEVPYDSLDFDLQHHLIVLDTRVNKVKVKMILDSGAELNLIDRNVHRRALDSFELIKRVNLIGVGQRQVEVLAGVLKGVSSGRQYNARMNTLLTSLDDINAAFGVHVHGVLGYEFLRQRRILINYTRRKLYFFNDVRS